jgi:tRNA(Arg) A34 adenosine deaminase TadA
MREYDLKSLRLSFQVAHNARLHGNHPFGAVLVDENSSLLMEAENTVTTGRDSTAHAETNLVRQASQKYQPDFLSRCTLYASTEPCPMCAGAIFWANIRRVVYGLDEAGLYVLVGEESDERLLLSCRQVFAQGGKSIEVIGPLLEEEALRVHIGFWKEAG